MDYINIACKLLESNSLLVLNDFLILPIANCICEEPFLIDWITSGPFFLKLRSLYIKEINKNKDKAKQLANCENIYIKYIFTKYLKKKSREKWPGYFGESLMEYFIHNSNDEIIEKDRKVICGKRSYQMDIITDKTIYECKTRRYTGTGTAGEKILGTPWKYSDVPKVSGKKLKIVLFGFQEYEAINIFNIEDPTSISKKMFIECFDRINIHYLRFSKIFFSLKGK